MRKFVTLLICIVLVFSMMTGCGPKEENLDSDGNIVTDKTKILDVNVWNAGYGIEWARTLATAFKAENPGIAVNIRSKADQGDFYNTITTGAGANETDLYFTYGPKYLKYVTGEYNGNKLLEPLDDVLSHKAASESKTIGEKFKSNILDALTYTDGTESKTYALTFTSSFSGIIYRADEFENYQLSIPKTTDEFVRLIVQIQESTPYNGVTAGVGGTPKTPLVHYPGYWQSVVQDWWAQYSGMEKFKSYWSFSNVNLSDMSSQQSLHQQQGLVNALEALSDIITPEGATYSGSNTMIFTDLQSRFLESDIALMYPCGTWLETEMEKAEDFNIQEVMNKFKIMKPPVISIIKEKLSEGNKSEEKLIQLIDYVDGTTDVRPVWATDEDVELISYARNVSTGQFSSSTVCVPSYSPAKDLAKEFLKFMYSDKGLKIFTQTQRATLPIDFDNSEVLNSIDNSSWTTFTKSCFEIGTNLTFVPVNLNHPIYYRTSLTELFLRTPESMFTNASKNDRETVTAFLNREWAEFMQSWNVIKDSAGIN